MINSFSYFGEPGPLRPPWNSAHVYWMFKFSVGLVETCCIDCLSAYRELLTSCRLTLQAISATSWRVCSWSTPQTASLRRNRIRKKMRLLRTSLQVQSLLYFWHLTIYFSTQQKRFDNINVLVSKPVCSVVAKTMYRSITEQKTLKSKFFLISL